MSHYHVIVEYEQFKFKVWLKGGKGHARCLTNEGDGFKRIEWTMKRDHLGRWLLADKHLMRWPDALLNGLEDAYQTLWARELEDDPEITQPLEPVGGFHRITTLFRRHRS